MDNTTYATYDYGYDDDDDYYDYNDTAAPVPTCDRLDDNYLAAQLSFLYYFMFLFSVFGNALVLVIIHRFEKLTTVTNILLLNLVISSLIFMSSLPFLAVYMQRSSWIFGDVMCKIVGGLYYLGLYSSVLFLTLLTFDRHLAVVYSLSCSRLRNRRYAIISCFVVWLVSGLACIKPMILHTTFRRYNDDRLFCQTPRAGTLTSHALLNLRISRFYIQVFLFLVAPVVIIVYCYVRIAITVISSNIVTKFRTIRLILFIVILFFICWIPFNVAQMMYDEAQTCEETQQLVYALHVTRNFAYFYFCISPIFYTFVGKKFRNHFRQLLVKRFPRLKMYISTEQCSRTSMATK